MKRSQGHVLLSCYAFLPGVGSEPGVGWTVAAKLAAHVDVTVLYGDVGPEGLQKRGVEKALQASPIEGLHPVYVPMSGAERLLFRAAAIPLLWSCYQVAYGLWQRRAYRVASELAKTTRFTAVHHLTFSGYREPGYLFKLGVPFFLGPVSGVTNLPISYWRRFGLLSSAARSAANSIQSRFASRVRHAAKTAAKVWASTKMDYDYFTSLGASVDLQLDNGCEIVDALPKRCDQGGKLNLVWSGLHIRRKGLPLLFDAIEQLSPAQRQRLQIHVLGAGPLEQKWKVDALTRGLGDVLRWHGRLPRDQALEVMNACHSLVLTSVLEGYPWVVSESLAMGLSVICHDSCGMGIAVTSRCGEKIPVVSPAVSASGFASAIIRLLDDPALVEERSKAALQRARELCWENKIQQLLKAYESVLVK